MSKICMGCMAPFEEEFEICPFCGFVEGTKATVAFHMEPGSILRERYIIGKVLGFGDFGVTYIGWDAVLELKVAIKEYLPSEFSTRFPGQSQVIIFEDGSKYKQVIDGLIRFIEEAQRLAKFHSLEGIVKVFDSFADNNTAYIIMEYLDGETLAERLKKQNTIPPDEAISMLMPIIRSLQIVHAEGIIHRNVSPDNIFLTKDGKVKLIDFGAYRFELTQLMQNILAIFTPAYSPEEQYYRRPDDLGSHTDVYAIGATLYRMITGVTPPDALNRRFCFERKQKDILKPVSRYCKAVSTNQEIAILNALNARIEDRTLDMIALENELVSEAPIKRKHGKIKKIDMLKWLLWVKLRRLWRR